jgi:hypothetical protein
MTPELINLLQYLVDALPSVKRQAPQELLEQVKLQVPKPRWGDEQRAKQSKTISEYWSKRRVEQPFQLKYRDGTVQNIQGWESAAKIAGVKESTLKIKFSKAGGLRAQFFDQELMEVVDIVKLPYGKEE